MKLLFCQASEKRFFEKVGKYIKFKLPSPWKVVLKHNQILSGSGGEEIILRTTGIKNEFMGECFITEPISGLELQGGENIRIILEQIGNAMFGGCNIGINVHHITALEYEELLPKELKTGEHILEDMSSYCPFGGGELCKVNIYAKDGRTYFMPAFWKQNAAMRFMLFIKKGPLWLEYGEGLDGKTLETAYELEVIQKNERRRK